MLSIAMHLHYCTVIWSLPDRPWRELAAKERGQLRRAEHPKLDLGKGEWLAKSWMHEEETNQKETTGQGAILSTPGGRVWVKMAIWLHWPVYWPQVG